MSLLDWTIVLLCFLASAAVGVYYARRAGSNLEEFFLSGRDLPWWPAGTSMVATTFAADTPLAVTELVAKNGIAGNWLWWNFVFGSVLTVFFASLPGWALRFTPAMGETTVGQAAGALALSVSAFLAYVGVQWWASWYPGAEAATSPSA